MTNNDVIKMKYNAILAMNRKNVIGRKNSIPWYIPEDLNYFRRITQNQVVIMGRKTFDSLPNGPLTKRINIVLTTDPSNYKEIENHHKGMLYFIKYEEIEYLLNKLEADIITKQIYIIGGSDIYKLFYPQYNTIHLTIVEDTTTDEKDVYSPFNEDDLIEKGYVEKYRESIRKSEKSKYEFFHVIYEK